MNRNEKKQYPGQSGRLCSMPVCLFIFILLFSFLIGEAHAELRNGMAAEVVIGQPNFTSSTANNGGIGARTLNLIVGVTSDGKHLAVSDDNNHRVLIWNQIPKANFVPADVVLGQPDFISNAANNGGRSAQSLRFPQNAFFAGGKFFVADQRNRRVLIWNQIPTSNFSPADVVVGQADFTTDTAAVTASGGNRLADVVSDGKRLIVADRVNNRVLIWNEIPARNGQAADVVLGQSDFVTNTAGTTQQRFSNPTRVTTDGERLFVGDAGNFRILIWNTIPTENFTPADVVVGQDNFRTNDSGAGQARIGTVSSLSTDGTRLFLASRVNQRVLIWNTIPTRNGAPADLVIGQIDFQSSILNDGEISARSFTSPSGLTYFGNQLAVADRDNSRVLIFNLSGGTSTDLGPQFSQGKAVVGKVYWDVNGNGVQEG